MPDRRRLVVPKHLREQILEEHHDAPYAGHFAAKSSEQETEPVLLLGRNEGRCT